MLVGSLTRSVILITAGFQTASAIVMAEADGRTLMFYTHNLNGLLVWKDVDHKVEGFNLVHTVLATPEGNFGVDQQKMIQPGQPTGKKWNEIAEDLYLDSSDTMTRHCGWVYLNPQDEERKDTGPNISESEGEIGHRESQSIDAPQLRPGNNNSNWFKIIYKEIQNERDPSGTGTAYVKATVSEAEARFYSGPDSRLKLKNMANVALDENIVPLSYRNCHFYVDSESESHPTIKDAYQSPITKDEQLKLDYKVKNLYVSTAFLETGEGDVVQLPLEWGTDAEEVQVGTQSFLPVRIEIAQMLEGQGYPPIKKASIWRLCCMWKPAVQA